MDDLIVLGHREFKVPGILVSGLGARELIAEVVSRLGLRSPIVVTDRALTGPGPVGRFLDRLVDDRIAVAVFGGVSAEPTTDHVDGILELIRTKQADGLIAVGGGSTIDAAKAAAAMATNTGAISAYEGSDRFVSPALPLVAIPTTAGTGSEVTRVAVIIDPSRHVKMLLMADQLLPRAAIVDAELTVSCPPAVTAAAGVDALSHAIEAFVSRRRQPLTDALALAAAGLIARSLRRAHASGDDLAARADVMDGQLQAGLAFSNSSVALVHGMSRPLGAVFGVPHGIANAMLLPTVMRYTMPDARDRYAQLAARLAGPDRRIGERTMLAPEAAVEAVSSLVADLGIPTLGGYGIAPEAFEGALDKMASDALASGSPANNPVVPTTAEIVDLYRACF